MSSSNPIGNIDNQRYVPSSGDPAASNSRPPPAAGATPRSPQMTLADEQKQLDETELGRAIKQLLNDATMKQAEEALLALEVLACEFEKRGAVFSNTLLDVFVFTCLTLF